MMIELVRVHRPDHADVVNDLGQMRQQFRHLDAALAVLLEGERAWHERPRMTLPHDDLALSAQRLPGIFVERGLGIERVHVRRTAVHEEMDDRFRFRLMMGPLGFEVVLRQRLRRFMLCRRCGSPAESARAARLPRTSSHRAGSKPSAGRTIIDLPG